MTPSNEIQIYTWMDATLKELTGLVKEVNPEARRRGTYFDFSLIYPDMRQSPRCQSRDIGTTVAGQRVSWLKSIAWFYIFFSRAQMMKRLLLIANSLLEIFSILLLLLQQEEWIGMYLS